MTHMTTAMYQREEVILLPHYTLGEHIRKARRDAGLDQADIADACRVSRPLVSKWERDISVPDVFQFRRLILATGANWLLDIFEGDAA